MFITFEGADGSGKSTQIRRLSTILDNAGIDHIITREPGGTQPAEEARALLLNEQSQPWPLWSEVFLLSAARLHHVKYVIQPAIDQGKWVLCDRFVESTRAYQRLAFLENPDFFDKIMQHACNGLNPNLTFILHLSEEKRKKRRRHFGGDCFENRDTDFQNGIYQHFANIAKAPPPNYIIIDASLSVNAVAQQIVQNIPELL